jgi:glycine/D-amino acid oxidase-like deaminating enzyme
MPKRMHVAVVGAGAFGGWTALHLLRNGARVTLIDAWGPGNSRSSSGGETRVIRGTWRHVRLNCGAKTSAGGSASSFIESVCSGWLLTTTTGGKTVRSMN